MIYSRNNSRAPKSQVYNPPWLCWTMHALVSVGPPESMREHVVAAAHAMQKGDWKACRNYITSIKVSTMKMSDSVFNSERGDGIFIERAMVQCNV